MDPNLWAIPWCICVGQNSDLHFFAVIPNNKEYYLNIIKNIGTVMGRQ